MLPLWTLVIPEKGLYLHIRVAIVSPLRSPGAVSEGSAVNQQEGGMSAQPVDLQIFGRSLRVNCPPEQRDALNQAADDLNQRLQDLKERTRVTNTEQLVFIAALNISYELTQEKRRPATTRLAWSSALKCSSRP